ncbi:MAG: hypothetical protein F4Z31_13265 [Gemmatimonadetes bacterium]|nr:hypothetical protein [Gemmatimonadota bacterium]MYE95542.1 hypothetical protein [Gemmatimonadota bacterium]MYJ12603.1 hypothetical protein [Gemmatimonadota bacterium]
MARHLTQAHIEMLARTVGTLEVATWNAVMELARQRLGHAYSRQALARHEPIRTALAARREQLGRKVTPRRPKPKTHGEAVLLNRIDGLEAELARLRAENESMMARFVIWAHNAHVLGIPDHRLDAPLQPVDRDYTEPDP